VVCTWWSLLATAESSVQFRLVGGCGTAAPVEWQVVMCRRQVNAWRDVTHPITRELAAVAGSARMCMHTAGPLENRNIACWINLYVAQPVHGRTNNTSLRLRLLILHATNALHTATPKSARNGFFHPSPLHYFTPGSKPTFSTNPFHRRFLLPTGLPHDNGTGPDRTYHAHHFIFSFAF